VSAKIATLAAVMIETGTVAIVPSEVTGLSVEAVTEVVVIGAVAADVTLMTDPVATCLMTDAAVDVVIAETVETVTEESASEAPHPRAARSLLLT
jgi:hypothetical protein